VEGLVATTSTWMKKAAVRPDVIHSVLDAYEARGSRREFPALSCVVNPSTQDGEQYHLATWTGISGDRFYRNCPGRTSRPSPTSG
jgi:hypothetical protein